MADHHNLKAFDETFDGFAEGTATATIRDESDRNFKQGDSVTFREGYAFFGVFKYTGREVSFRISRLDRYGCIENHVCIHLKDRNLMIVKDPSHEDLK